MGENDGHRVFDLSHTARPFTCIYRSRFPNGMANANAPHYHPDTIEVCFVARGHLDWWIGDEALEIRPGDVLVVPPGLPHGSVDSTLQPCEFFAVHVAPEMLPPTVAGVAEGLRGRIAGHPELGNLVRRVFDAHEEDGPLLPEVAPALAILLFATLERAHHDAAGRPARTLVRRAQALLARGEGATPTVEAVAGRLGVSAAWLARLFREELSESPGEWVRSRRLAEAKRLLALERTSVTEIALRLGYSSSQYFASAFRHECGMTPSAYRALCAARMPARQRSAIPSPMR